MQGISFNALNRSSASISQSMQRISTGTKHPSASYGSSYAISQRMYSDIGTIVQSNNNTQNTNAMLSTASGAISNTLESLSSLKQTLLEAANGATPSNTLALRQSIAQTIDQINSNANIKYNGIELLYGDVNVSVVGIYGNDENVALGDMTAAGLRLVDEQGKMNIDLDDVDSSIDLVDNAIDKALEQATTIGATQQGLDYQSANYTSMEENATESVSVMNDTNIAEEVSRLKNEQTLQTLALHAIGLYKHNQASALKLLE